MSHNILDQEYIPPNRPYSQLELLDNQSQFYNDTKLNPLIFAHHQNCGHFYLVKKNGKKERDILNDNNAGNCSVCWNLMNTPYDLKDKAERLIEGYMSEFRVPPDYLTYELLDLEMTYYRWIYTKQFQNTKRY
jgi:hypothetical protein